MLYIQRVKLLKPSMVFYVEIRNDLDMGLFFVISKVLLTKQPNVSILWNAKVFFANSTTQFGPNNNSSDLTKKMHGIAGKKYFHLGVYLVKMVQFFSHVKYLLFLAGKVSSYPILGHEERKNMLTIVETFRSNATKTECILMHCSRKSTNNIESAKCPRKNIHTEKFPCEINPYPGKIDSVFFCDGMYLSNYQGLK